MSTPSQRTAAETPMSSPEPAGTPPRILVVEDDREIAETISAELIANGYRVELRDTYAAGLEAVHSAQYAVILIDRGLQERMG